MPETFFSSGDTFSCCTTLTIVLLIKMSILYARNEFKIQNSKFKIVSERSERILGGYCGGVPPLPIPNREVKPACADGTAMQCGRVGGCLLYFRSSESNDFGDLFLFRRVWHPAIPTPPPMVSVCVGIARMLYPPMIRWKIR